MSVMMKGGLGAVARVFVLVAGLEAADARAQHQPVNEAPLSPAERALAVRQAERQELVDHAVGNALVEFGAAKLRGDQLAVTLIDLRDGEPPVRVSYRGEAQIYPASVVKLFYLVAAHRQMEDGKLADTAELRRAMRDMIVDSYNEAAGYVVDLLTGTTSGPELPAAEMEQWHEQREAVNRYFASLSYTNINVNKKPWCEGPYGRETQAINLYKPTQNLLTTDATARLLTEIVTGKAVSVARCEQMKALLWRDLANPDNTNPQARNYTGMALPPGSKLWSKAGGTDEMRHDAAYVELPNGARFVLVIFTVGHANEPNLIGNIARFIVQELGKEK
jgi:beta-lactamase class A